MNQSLFYFLCISVVEFFGNLNSGKELNQALIIELERFVKIILKWRSDA
jgi:hypothetical protein